MGGAVMAFQGKTLTVYLAADLKKWNTGVAQAQTGIAGFSNSLKNMLGPAALGAAAAVGALAVKMAVDGVNAAIEDEKAQASLAKTLENVGLAHDVQPIEDYISSLERSLGVADEELRPAYDRLIRSIGNTEEANKALSLALDISAVSQKSVQQVAEALGKAYDGNTAGLNRLGAGIDSAILKTGDMALITQTLSNTFAGQATVAAGEFEGQMRVLNVAVDNLAEAFGRGLIKSFESAMEQSGNMADKLADLEDEAETAGATMGSVALSALDVGTNVLSAWSSVVTFNRGLQESNNILAKAVGFLNPFNVVSLVMGDNLQAIGDEAANAATALDDSNIAAQTAAGGFSRLSYQVGMATDAYSAYVRANAVGRSIIANANQGYKDLAARQRDVNTFTSDGIDLTNNLTAARGGASSATNKQAEAENKLTKAFQDQQSVITGLSGKLQKATSDLEAARKAAEDYAQTMMDSIMAEINLADAYEAQFDEEGKKTGKTLVEAFQEQIAGAQWFGNVLTELRNQGADQSLIEHIASLGPNAGGALAQQMIDEGLVKTLSDKWVEVQDQTKTLAMGLVPEFMTAGIASGEAMVTSLAEQVKNETKILTRLGRQIAKPVGAGFKAQFLKDIADAVAEVEAIQTAARAEKIAAATARGQILTEQAVAQALGQIINRSDARLGVTNQPVLA